MIKMIISFEELVQHHISGQLKVAPEHISNHAFRQDGQTKTWALRKIC